MEICALDTFEGIGEVMKISLGGHGKDTESPRYPESLSPGGEYAFPVIDEEQISVEFHSESDSVCFASVDFLHGKIAGMTGLAYFHT